MERGFLSQKGSEGGRGVKEKKHSSAQDATMDTDNVDRVSVIATKLGIPLMLDSSYTSDTCMQSWGRSSYTREMIKFRVDVELKDTIVVFGHVLNDCPMNIILEVVKNLKNPRQAARDVQVGPKVAVASKEVRNSNPFDVLNLVEKRCDFGLKCGADGGYATNSLLEQWDDNKTGVIITPLR
ncbi:hypothetical protein Tco_1345716 [Tanacetum coccineum]